MEDSMREEEPYEEPVMLPKPDASSRLDSQIYENDSPKRRKSRKDMSPEQ
jgi:hypothetical protein